MELTTIFSSTRLILIEPQPKKVVVVVVIVVVLIYVSVDVVIVIVVNPKIVHLNLVKIGSVIAEILLLC